MSTSQPQPSAPRAGTQESPVSPDNCSHPHTKNTIGKRVLCSKRKLGIAISAGTLSVFSILLAYAIGIFFNPIFILTLAACLIVLNINSAIWIGRQKRSVVTTGGLIPVLFALGAGILMLSMGAIEVSTKGLLPTTNAQAAIPSFGVLGGLGLGATIGYLSFTSDT